MPGSVWLILPTYDEVANLEGIVAQAREVLRAAAHEDHAILVVDDDSPDGTGLLADRLAAGSDVVGVLHRSGRRGLGTAYVEGFTAALEQGAELLLEMDADFSHDPADLARLIAAARGGADLAIGSRYVTGGRIEGWSRWRRLVSRGGCLYARAVLRVPVRDLTSGLKCVRADALRAVDHGSMRASGYAFQIELTHRVLRRGLRVIEVPIVFRERREGRSTMSWPVVWEAAWRVPQLRFLAERSGRVTGTARAGCGRRWWRRRRHGDGRRPPPPGRRPRT